MARRTTRPPDDDLDRVAAGATHRDAARLAQSFRCLDIGEDVRADLIALVACVAFCPATDRDGMFYEVVSVLMPDFEESRRAVERKAAGRIRAKKGGA
ncbi:MAG TPA: hypothetical protein VIP46_22155 [Pyrinomonadaceae bacterium]